MIGQFGLGDDVFVDNLGTIAISGFKAWVR